jgi:hypothetical protein
MNRVLFCLLLVALTTGAQAASSCSVPRFRTLYGQTVDGYMTVKSGRRCSVTMTSSRGPTDDVRILARPAHGNVHVEGPHRVVYQSRAGYVGGDSFTYARHGLDTRNNPATRTVRVVVSVTP